MNVSPIIFSARCRGAFTLVELVVVIGIIGLLTAVLLPALRASREQAGRVACMNNLRVFGQCAQMYVNDFKGALPWEGWAEGDREERNIGRWEDHAQWFNVVGTYSKRPTYNEMQLTDRAGGESLPKADSHSLYVCPEAHEPSVGIKDDVIEDGYLMLWGLDDKDAIERRRTYWCYAYNSQLDGGIEERTLDKKDPSVKHRVTIRQNQIRQSSLTVLLLERIMYPRETTPTWNSGVGTTTTSYTRFTTRHHGGGFLLMIDFHVQYFTRRELTTPVNDADGQQDYNRPGVVIWNPAGKSL